MGKNYGMRKKVRQKREINEDKPMKGKKVTIAKIRIRKKRN